MAKSSPPPDRRAFTLIELLVVIGTIGIMAAFALPVFNGVLGSPVSPISYGINSNIYSGGVAISADRITKPVTFIVFSPAQDTGTTVSFNTNATVTAAAPGVTEYAGTSSPGGAASGGTQNSRTKINALCADWHVETMLWGGTGPAFTNTTATGIDPDGELRWKPYTPYP